MILGIAGRAGAGKDTVGRLLRDNHYYAIVAFANPIKRMLCTLLNVPMEKWEDRDWKETVLPGIGFTPRQLAQTLGAEWGRALSEDFWIRIAKRSIEETKAGFRHHDNLGKNFVITDVRFENEASAIRAMGGLVVHVDRPGSIDGTAFSEHSSEAGIERKFNDYVILNDKAISNLAHEVDKLAVTASLYV